VYDTTGGFDAIVIGRFRSTRAMDSLLKKLQTFDFVERTNTKLILNTVKEDQIRLRS
jgi:Lrp/AsnC family transcriptional regulator for asnA, asnC and gidA